MWIRSTSEWLPSGCLPLGHHQAWTGPVPGRQRAGAALPSPTPAADHPWAQMVGMTCGRISPATATRRATGHRGWESGLGWGCYRQATANDVSKRRPNFHHQLPSTMAVPDGGNDKRPEATLRLPRGYAEALEPADSQEIGPQSRPGSLPKAPLKPSHRGLGNPPCAGSGYVTEFVTGTTKQL